MADTWLLYVIKKGKIIPYHFKTSNLTKYHSKTSISCNVTLKHLKLVFDHNYIKLYIFNYN
jgi:hypothetical protein